MYMCCMWTTKSKTIFETLRATARESNARVASKEVSDNTVRRERAGERRKRSTRITGRGRSHAAGGSSEGGVAPEERVEALLHEEAGRREHADAAVRQLRLTQPVDLALALALEEAGGIEVAEDVVAAGQAERELVGERVLLGGLLAHRDGHARRHLGGCDERGAG